MPIAIALLLLLPALANANEFERLSRFVESNPGSPTATACPMTLGQLLARVRSRYPEAVVTGRFSDPRGVSIYRSHPGLHYGYDLAPAGSVVPAAWEGEVVAITPWHGQEEGISVVSGSREATYGHLIPLVKMGQRVKIGDPVGIVARDHVDVKMRGPAGEFIDYGAGEAEFSLAPLTPEDRNRSYLYARFQFLRTERQLKTAQAERKRVLKNGDESSELKAKDAEYAHLYEEGAVARIDYEKMHKKLTDSLKQAKTRPARLKEISARIADLDSQLRQNRGQLAEAQKQVNVKSALGYLNAFLANHSSDKRLVAQVTARPMKLAPLRPDLDELLEEGVISLLEYRQMGGRAKKSEAESARANNSLVKRPSWAQSEFK